MKKMILTEKVIFTLGPAERGKGSFSGVRRFSVSCNRKMEKMIQQKKEFAEISQKNLRG